MTILLTTFGFGRVLTAGVAREALLRVLSVRRTDKIALMLIIVSNKQIYFIFRVGIVNLQLKMEVNW